MRYLIALPLKESECQEFIGIRDRYRTMAPRWKITLGPHITLFRPSEFLVGIDEAIRIFTTAPTQQEFNQVFNKFDAFMNHSNNVVYAEPADHDKFKIIKTAYQPMAERILEDTTEVWPYHPHLTLINRLDEAAAQELLMKLNKENISMSFGFDRVCLYKKTHEDSAWVEIASNQLSGS